MKYSYRLGYNLNIKIKKKNNNNKLQPPLTWGVCWGLERGVPPLLQWGRCHCLWGAQGGRWGWPGYRNRCPMPRWTRRNRSPWTKGRPAILSLQSLWAAMGPKRLKLVKFSLVKNYKGPQEVKISKKN